MADQTSRVIDLIDGAIRDYVSPDAMRWVPEDEREPAPLDADQIARLYDVPPSLVSSPGGTLRPGPNARVWVNGQEVTQHISSITVEREMGSRTRIGFNGGEPVVRDNVRVEVEQDGSTYVIEESHAWWYGASQSRLRAPCASPVAYWPGEQPPEQTGYGIAYMRRHDDGTVTVDHADRVIGVHAELWDEMRMPHRRSDGTLWLDTAGEYRYRFVRHEYAPEVLVFARIEGEAR